MWLPIQSDIVEILSLTYKEDLEGTFAVDPLQSFQREAHWLGHDIPI